MLSMQFFAALSPLVVVVVIEVVVVDSLVDLDEEVGCKVLVVDASCTVLDVDL